MLWVVFLSFKREANSPCKSVERQTQTLAYLSERLRCLLSLSLSHAMDFETVAFQLQDPFSCKDPEAYSHPGDNINDISHQDMEYYSSLIVQGNCDDWKDNYWGEIGTNSPASSENGSCRGGGFPSAAAAAIGRGKRRKARTEKNREDVESQRMTHIAVERNRRRQMNEYLDVLRSMMPPSYVQRVIIGAGPFNYDFCTFIIIIYFFYLLIFKTWRLGRPFWRIYANIFWLELINSSLNFG